MFKEGTDKTESFLKLQIEDANEKEHTPIKEMDSLDLAARTSNRIQYVEKRLESELQSDKSILKETDTLRVKLKKGEDKPKGKTAVDRKEWVEHLATLVGQMVWCYLLHASQYEFISILYLAW